MAWLETKTDTAADAASAKMLVSQSETTDYLYQHPSCPLKTTIKTEVTLYRGLTQDAATAFASSLVKSGDLEVVFYYGGAAVSGEVVAALSFIQTRWHIPCRSERTESALGRAHSSSRLSCEGRCNE